MNNKTNTVTQQQNTTRYPHTSQQTRHNKQSYVINTHKRGYNMTYTYYVHTNQHIIIQIHKYCASKQNRGLDYGKDATRLLAFEEHQFIPRTSFLPTLDNFRIHYKQTSGAGASVSQATSKRLEQCVQRAAHTHGRQTAHQTAVVVIAGFLLNIVLLLRLLLVVAALRRPLVVTRTLLVPLLVARALLVAWTLLVTLVVTAVSLLLVLGLLRRRVAPGRLLVGAWRRAQALVVAPVRRRAGGRIEFGHGGQKTMMETRVYMLRGKVKLGCRPACRTPRGSSQALRLRQVMKVRFFFFFSLLFVGDL